jgi:hypothetical protein
LQPDDVAAGILKLDNLPLVEHPSIPKDQVEAFSKVAICGMLVTMKLGGWATSDEWNKLLPDYKFTTVEEFAQKLAAME